MIIMDLFRKKQQCIEAIEMSAEAKAIAEAPIIKEFFDKAESAILDAWRQTPDAAQDVRERLFLVNKILDNFKQHFNAYLVNGQFAERQLKEIIEQEAQTGKKH